MSAKLPLTLKVRVGVELPIPTLPSEAMVSGGVPAPYVPPLYTLIAVSAAFTSYNSNVLFEFAPRFQLFALENGRKYWNAPFPDEVRVDIAWPPPLAITFNEPTTVSSVVGAFVPIPTFPSLRMVK